MAWRPVCYIVHSSLNSRIRTQHIEIVMCNQLCLPSAQDEDEVSIQEKIKDFESFMYTAKVTCSRIVSQPSPISLKLSHCHKVDYKLKEQQVGHFVFFSDSKLLYDRAINLSRGAMLTCSCSALQHMACFQ